MKDLDFAEYNEKLGKSARATLANAIEESRKREQNYLSPYHLILALLSTEAEFFANLLANSGHNIKDFRTWISNELQSNRNSNEGRGLKMTVDIKTIFRLAWISAFQHGRNKISAPDFIQACMQVQKSPLIACLQTLGITYKTVKDALEPRLENPVTKSLKSSELSEEEKIAIKNAVQGDDYWKAYELLSAFYQRTFENIREERDQRRKKRAPKDPFPARSRFIKIVAALVLLAVIILLVIFLAA